MDKICYSLVAFKYWYEDKKWKATLPARMQSTRWRVWGPYNSLPDKPPQARNVEQTIIMHF